MCKLAHVCTEHIIYLFSFSHCHYTEAQRSTSYPEQCVHALFLLFKSWHLECDCLLLHLRGHFHKVNHSQFWVVVGRLWWQCQLNMAFCCVSSVWVFTVWGARETTLLKNMSTENASLEISLWDYKLMYQGVIAAHNGASGLLFKESIQFYRKSW